MSFTDYVNHMTQKYRLAVGIAILKSKPEDLSIEQYLSALRSKINDENNTDTDADLHISVCSEDFKIDDDGNVNSDFVDLVTSLGDADDSTTILKDFNVNIEGDNFETNSISEVLTILRGIEKNTKATKSPDVGANNIGSTYSAEAPQALNVVHNNTSIISENFKIQCDIEPNTNNNLAAVILKNIDKDVNLNDKQGNDTCLTVDSDLNKTILKVDATPCKIINKNNDTGLEFSAQSENAKCNNKLATKIHKNITKKISNLGISSEQPNNKNNKDQNNTTNDNRNETYTHLNTKTLIIQPNKKHYKDQNKIVTTEWELIANSEQTNACNQELAKKIYKNVNISDVNPQNDSPAPQIYSWDGFTQMFTHISQSQSENIVIGEKFIHGNRVKNRLDDSIDKTSPDNKNNHINKDLADTALENEIDDQMQDENRYILENINEQTCLKNGNHHIKKDLANAAIANDIEDQIQVENDQTTTVNLNSSEIQYILVDKDGRTYRLLKENVENLFKSANESSSIVELNTRQPETYQNETNIDSQMTDIQEITTYNQHIKDIETTEDIVISLTKNIETTEVREQTDDLVSSDEDMMSSKDVVPFKVMEELNKVKVYLNRNDRVLSVDGNSTDSGYRSNSNRSSCKSAQLSWHALDQSAHCLFTHLMGSPLVGATQDVLKEISQVLGRLIDALHDEETYPTFLQDILSTNNCLLQELYTGPTSDDNVLLKKDENIQRLSLLNRSLQISEYTIEKITHILEQMYTHLTTEETYELINIDEVENLAYIFHMLEIVIKRYKSLKTKNISSQATQSQDEDKMLKKSSISDIWRKKWNPNFETEERIEDEQKVCCLTKCGAVLNKIIVDCMEGYSLVSFAALQCFNLLQVE